MQPHRKLHGQSGAVRCGEIYGKGDGEMETWLKLMHGLVWGPGTLVIFLGAGLLFTIRSRGFQLLGARDWLGATVGALVRDSRTGREKGKITPFQSACTALAATIGTGNIVGVATALTCGGPGALLWMWISAAIGMMTAYAETYLGQKYRYRKPDGHWMCGPMVYMERGLHSRGLGILYAGLAVLVSLGMGSMVQSNSVSTTLSYGLGLPSWACALGITALVALVILGGIGRIFRVAECLMPVSAGIYLLFSAVILLSCLPDLPAVFAMIFRDALRPETAAGGIGGFFLSSSVRYGLSRGVFSNEAGLGSLAVLHGAAEDTTPEQQGMWAMFEVFFDTIVICTLTALVILCMEYRCGGAGGAQGAALAAKAFGWRLGQPGSLLVCGALVVFAFATIVAWYYLGMQNFSYFIGKLKGMSHLEKAYPALYLTAVFAGCVCRMDLVWLVSDLWNGLMAFPNLLALVLLAKQVPYPGRSVHFPKKQASSPQKGP